jgi:mannose-1-phosphate guanylyltransferase/mannose-1-phosphate guanylyltransferase/mannose-6-phosphate isomerase
VIVDAETFRDAVVVGAELARADKLVTFGIMPDKPETGYGYIRAGERLECNRSAEGRVTSAEESHNQNVAKDVYSAISTQHPELNIEHPALTGYAVAKFVEKPDLATAEGYLASGDYYWNSGMFMFRASRYLEELEKFAPQMLVCCREALDKAQVDLDFVRLDAGAFAACPKDSIDYAVMEKTAEAVVIPLDAGWSDVGSWSALWEVGAMNLEGNVVRGDVLTHDSRNCYLHSTGRMVAAVGLVDHVVVETADAVLVAPRDRAQDVKAIVEQLKAQGRGEALLHRRVNRPWGAYECIDAAERSRSNASQSILSKVKT